MATARDTALSINMVMNSAIKGANFLQASVYGIYKYAKQVERIDLLKRTKFPLLKRNLTSLENHLGHIRKVSAQISNNPIRLDVSTSRNSLKEARKDITAIRKEAQIYRNYTKLSAEDLRRGTLVGSKNLRKSVNKERASIGAGGVVGTAMAVAPAVLPLKGAMNFESVMLRVKALSGANEKDFKSMENKALELGAKTQYKSTEVAQGMQYLVMAGFKPKQINSAMKGVLNLATAGDIDLKTTADISSNILGGFQLPAKKMNMVADIMAKTITTANVDIRMLGDSMKYAAPIAKKAGMSLAETSAMAGLLGNIGIQGTMAGTTLKSVITRLSAPPTEAKKVLDKLHIKTADSKGHLKSIPLLLQELYDKTKSVGNAKQLEYFKKVFGLEPLAGGTKLIELAGKGELKKYISIVNDYKGTAERIAGIQLSGVEGHLKLLGSAFDNLSIKMSKAMLPELKEYIKTITNGVNRVEAWASAHPKLASNLYKTALAIGVGTVALATFGFVASGVASAIGVLSMPLVAVAGVATAGYLLWKDYGNGLVFVKGALAGAKEGLDDILKLAHGVREVLSSAKKEVVSFAQSIGLLSSNTQTNFLDRANGKSFGKYAVYAAGIYGSIKVLKMLKGALFGVNKASKDSCNSLGCIGTSALSNSKTATGALGGLLNKVKSLALFLRANPIVIGITLAGAGVAYLNSKTFKAIEAKHIVGLDEKGLVEREAYLKKRLKSMKNPGIMEYFIHGSPNKYKIRETEKLLKRVQNKLHYVRTVGVAPTIIKPANNLNYKDKPSSNTQTNFLDRANGKSFGKYAVYAAGIYGSIKVLKMLKGALFGVNKASKDSCNSLGCIGTSALSNSKTATGALGGLLNKVKSLALFLRANPIVIGITLAGAGVAYLNSKTFKAIEAKHIVGLDEKGLVEREAYLKKRLKSMKNPGIMEYFIHGSPNKYKIRETEKLLKRVQNKLHYVRTVGVAPTIIKPANNLNYKDKPLSNTQTNFLDRANGKNFGNIYLKNIKEGVGEKLPLSSLLKESESFKTKLQTEAKNNNFTNSKVVHQNIASVNIHIKSTDGVVDEEEIKRQVMRAIKEANYEDRDTQMRDIA